jgi:hypothetical protein
MPSTSAASVVPQPPRLKLRPLACRCHVVCNLVLGAANQLQFCNLLSYAIKRQLFDLEHSLALGIESWAQAGIRPWARLSNIGNARESARDSLPRRRIEKQSSTFSIWHKPGPSLRYSRPALLEERANGKQPPNVRRFRSVYPSPAASVWPATTPRPWSSRS